MLRHDPSRPHHVTVAEIRRHITVPYDLDKLDTAHEEHIKAKVAFSVSNTDNTMINLIGTWARLNRIISDMDDKYGSRR